MKNTFIILFCLILYSCSLLAQQNLVQNYSFEQKTQCCDRIDNCVSTWTSLPSADAYYFNPCNPLYFSAPRTFPGVDYQQAKTGSSFAGIRLYTSFPYNRDYLITTLSDTLTRGETYIIEFYASLSTYGKYAADRLGMYISSSPVTNSGLETFTYVPQIENTSGLLLQDSTSWTKITGSYIAKGGEKYICIGNFYNDVLTTYLQLMPLSTQEMALYFIDDVSVKKYEAPAAIIMPSSFTPNDDGKNDVFKPEPNSQVTNGTMSVYNRWGSIVCKTDNLMQGWDGSNDKKKCESGVYYYIIKYSGPKGEEQITGNVTLIR